VKRCVILFALLSIGFGTQARALDSSGTVYIDGVPCNLLCQSYMAWSRRVLKERTRPSPSDDAASPAIGTAMTTPSPAVRSRVARHALAVRLERGKERRAESSRRADNARMAKASVSKPPDVLPPMQSPVQSTAPHEALDSPKAPAPETNSSRSPGSAARETNNVAPADPRPAEVPERGTSKLSDAPITEAKPAGDMSSRPAHDATGDAAPIRIRRQVLAAVAVAEQLTAAGAPELKAMHGEHANDATNTPADAPEAIGPEENALVALVVTRPEINSLAELAEKDVAIDQRRLSAENDVRTALVAAGAVAVRLSDSDTLAIDRLMRGEVPAAVLTLLSPDSAEVFPSLAGLSVFKVPLSPRSVEPKQQDGDPAK
jgi:hypothetical protein